MRRLALTVLVIASLIFEFIATPPDPVHAAGCISTVDCLSKMTLDEKIGQMTQVAHNYLASPSDIAEYNIGALLSGGGGGPVGERGTASQWADMYDNYQSYALKTRLGIPLIYGVDAVHGHALGSPLLVLDFAQQGIADQAAASAGKLGDIGFAEVVDQLIERIFRQMYGG